MDFGRILMDFGCSKSMIKYATIRERLQKCKLKQKADFEGGGSKM